MAKIKMPDEYCHVCGRQLKTWDVKCSQALAFKNCTCENCIAEEYGETVGELRRKLESFFEIRPSMDILIYFHFTTPIIINK